MFFGKNNINYKKNLISYVFYIESSLKKKMEMIELFFTKNLKI